VETILPPGWPRPSGYANGAASHGRIIAVAGQIGWYPATQHLACHDLVGQARQALENIAAILRAGGAECRHVIRLTWYITDADEYHRSLRALGDAYRSVFGAHYPAMSVVVVKALVEPGAVVEIEATAVV
jgi:enamine deaminase RidA (YjgF/YER057c/UK114 family)